MVFFVLDGNAALPNEVVVLLLVDGKEVQSVEEEVKYKYLQIVPLSLQGPIESPNVLQSLPLALCMFVRIAYATVTLLTSALHWIPLSHASCSPKAYYALFPIQGHDTNTQEHKARADSSSSFMG